MTAHVGFGASLLFAVLFGVMVVVDMTAGRFTWATGACAISALYLFALAAGFRRAMSRGC